MTAGHVPTTVPSIWQRKKTTKRTSETERINQTNGKKKVESSCLPPTCIIRMDDGDACSFEVLDCCPAGGAAPALSVPAEWVLAEREEEPLSECLLALGLGAFLHFSDKTCLFELDEDYSLSPLR